MGFLMGDGIVRRCVHLNGRIAAVDTARVVDDGPDGLLTWTATGSEVMRRTTLTGESARYLTVAERAVTPTMLTPTTWRGAGMLMLTPRNSDYSVWWFYNEDGGFKGWYVNLEDPSRRWELGFDIRDLALDVWVSPDYSWSWKDEDEFADRTGHPEFWSAERAVEIRAAGEKAIAAAEAREAPFDGRYTDFVPDPNWEPTRLPPMWDRPA